LRALVVSAEASDHEIQNSSVIYVTQLPVYGHAGAPANPTAM